MRYAIRSLRRSPALAAIAIASLALGIGVNLTVYSVVRELLLDNISARRLDRLVRIDANLTYTLYRELRPAAPFEDVAFETGFHDVNWQARNHAEVAWAMDTSPNFFDVLGVRAGMGRLYGQSDEGHPVAVVTNAFWRRRLQSDSAVVGRTLQLNGQLYTVVGVLPRDYRSVMGHGVSPEIYAPAHIESRQNCRLFARLRDGVTRAQARAAWITVAERVGGSEFARRVSALRPMGGLAAGTGSQGDDRDSFLFFAMLFGVAGLLTLIASANVAGLLLARGVSRQRETAIRKALGASPWQVVKPVLAEATVLASCGCAAALAIDALLRSQLGNLRWPNAYNIPIEFHFQSDRGLLLYALGTTLVVLAISSFQPAVSSAKTIAPAARGPRPIRFAGLQVVLSVLLLALGALFGRSLLHLMHSDVGFDAAHTVIASLHPLSRPREVTGVWRERLIQQAVQRIAMVPGVLGITSTDILPLMGEMPQTPIRLAGDPIDAAREVYFLAGGEQYFSTMQIRMLRGRDFETGDRNRKPTPAIINRTLARQLFGDRDPIGASLLRGREKEEVLEVIGVAADSKMRTLGEGSMPAIYIPDYNGQFVVRVAGDPRQWTEPLRSAMGEVDGTSALDVRPMKDALDGALFPMRIAAGFVGGLSCLGLALSLVGLYGSVSYAVGRRTREMGIRAALGATRTRILWTALRDGMTVVTAGIVAGLALSIGAIRPLVTLLPDGVDPWDPLLFAGVGLFVLATAVAATVVPARRAAVIDPSAALREE